MGKLVTPGALCNYSAHFTLQYTPQHTTGPWGSSEDWRPAEQEHRRGGLADDQVSVTFLFSPAFSCSLLLAPCSLLLAPGSSWLLLRGKEEQKEETSDQKEESKQKGGVGNKSQKRPWDGDYVPVRGDTVLTTNWVRGGGTGLLCQKF